VITVKSVDVETGRIDFAESEKCMKEDDLELASKILAVKLVNNIAGTSYAVPIRTYKQDESRNKFAVGMSYKLGLIKNVNVPFFKAEKNGIIESLILTSAKRDIYNQTAVFSPSYEFTDNFGIRIDFKYIYTKLKQTEGYYSILGYYTSGPDYENTMLSDDEGECLDNGYGVDLNAQLIYPVGGFNLYIIPGLGIGKYNLKNPWGKGSYGYDSSDGNSYFSDYVLEMKTRVYTYLLKLEAGFSVYVSKFVDLYFSAGIDYHIFSKLISDVKIKETELSISGTPPDEQKNMLKNTEIDFKGNFPPEYYVQAGIVLRLF